jgi:hypothetical protein
LLLVFLLLILVFLNWRWFLMLSFNCCHFLGTIFFWLVSFFKNFFF